MYFQCLWIVPTWKKHKTIFIWTNWFGDLFTKFHIQYIRMHGQYCLDLASWEQIKQKDGKDFSRTKIGLSKNCEDFRNTFSEKFQEFISGFDDWFREIGDFRHAVAHRIPLYVPPFNVTDEEAKKLAELEEEKRQMLRQHRFDDYERIDEEIESIGTFIPCMMHSFSEQSKQVVFHAQLIADWNTVHSISMKFIDELWFFVKGLIMATSARIPACLVFQNLWIMLHWRKRGKLARSIWCDSAVHDSFLPDEASDIPCHCMGILSTERRPEKGCGNSWRDGALSWRYRKIFLDSHTAFPS